VTDNMGRDGDIRKRCLVNADIIEMEESRAEYIREYIEFKDLYKHRSEQTLSR
jgi:hypothetical protein